MQVLGLRLAQPLMNLIHCPLIYIRKLEQDIRGSEIYHQINPLHHYSPVNNETPHTSMHGPRRMNIRQPLCRLQRHLPRHLPPQPPTPPLQARTLIKHLNTRSANLTHHTQMMSIRPINPKMIEHTHHKRLPHTLLTVPQPPQNPYLRTIPRESCGQDFERDIALTGIVAGEPDRGEAAMPQLVDHGIAALLEGVV